MSTIFIISAPSGSGKSTLVASVRSAVSNLDFSISYTTRTPRGSERNGVEYYFVTRAEFERMIANGDFLEYADVFGNYYGTARRFVEDAQRAGHDLLLDIDVQGAAQIKQKLPEAVSIFVLPPSRDELERRLRRRSESEGVQNQDVIRRRLLTATKEIENWEKYDYILVNDRLEESIDKLKAVVLAERLRRSRQAPADEQLRMIEQAEACRRQSATARIQGTLDSFRQNAPA